MLSIHSGRSHKVSMNYLIRSDYVLRSCNRAIVWHDTARRLDFNYFKHTFLGRVFTIQICVQISRLIEHELFGVKENTKTILLSNSLESLSCGGYFIHFYFLCVHLLDTSNFSGQCKNMAQQYVTIQSQRTGITKGTCIMDNKSNNNKTF